MNEVENHYSGQSGDHQGTGDGRKSAPKSKPGPSNPAEVAKAALDQATSTAKESLKGAKRTADSTIGAARDAVGDGYDKASAWASDRIDSASRSASNAGRRSAEGFTQSRDGVQRFVDENPIMVGVVGFAAGLLIGSLLPGTRRENQVFGRYADEVRDQGLRYARDLAEQGKHFVEESLDASAKPKGPDDGRPPARG